MLVARIGTGVFVAAALSVFGGCQSVGPIAIDAGRDRYNSVLQETSKQQAFENIIRVHNNEPTSFMDVTEVDATQTFSSTVSGTVGGIGAKSTNLVSLPPVGSVTPGATYTESPLIRYVPLVGQGLVEQTVAPVNTDALASLYDADWGVMPLLDLSTAFLTLDWDQYGAILNLMAELEYDYRLELTSIKSDWTRPKNTSGGGSGNDNTGSGSQSNKKAPTSESLNDALVVNFLDVDPHASGRRDDKDQVLWRWLTSYYKDTQAPPCTPTTRAAGKAKSDRGAGEHPTVDESADQAAANAAAATKAAADAAKAAADAAKAAASGAAAKPPPQDRTQPSEQDNCMPGGRYAIELRTMQVTKTPNPFKSAAPLMRTFSALGILKNATQPPYPRIGFVNPEVYRKITSYPWNNGKADPRLNVYTLYPGPEDVPEEELRTPLRRRWTSERNKDDEKYDEKHYGMIKKWLANAPTPIPYVFVPNRPDDFVEVNDLLWRLRRYVLIIQSDVPPPANAYIAYFDRGRWYYIDGDDRISQKNFNLISIFLTVMAVPPTNSPLTTSISIGGGG